MFGFLDRDTPQVANRLFERAQEVDLRYLSLSASEMATQIKIDFPLGMRSVGHDQIGFIYEDLPDFSFTVMWMLDEPLFSIFGGGRFAGFMLQRASARDRWNTGVNKPLASPLGARAERLADIFERQHGVRNPGKVLRRFHQQIR